MNIMPKKILLVVACAVFGSYEKVLLSCRPKNKSYAGFWEFPGGKIEDGETPEEALVRELSEELSIIVKPVDLIPLTFVSHSYDKFHLLMPFFSCHHFEGSPRSCEGQEIKWVSLDDVKNHSILPADQPLISFLQRYSHHI
ncbi:NTP pyrophosphohydrolase [Candidatus Liberibacter solanacearum]|uniref:8-oxo-dGTP diphosphatase n=2 Tax=Candidatus Liberibacter solanacearum TaxID=556287 RepID=A0A094Z3B3_9HYPH|nr:(deoxy)nucleoside triphosphate pyrophosphohydrolase [Candidatus Liberibacter solanacearum]ADR52251.1 mutator MutT protein [Candidatus Liberibacter solanacearum CLso-ZC1]KGB27444.1 NTP pyrophosphohydrolase [Candidatus Liberibacter solanacearum]KJZ81159.1 NTP pyrophosphohydrolase [Candidatus Liberibacter solanacearum]KJZ82380.1 5-methyl-dCTP pyrophosphohydrolase [Candidatus Liberibacter solanacearum]KQC49233.1 NTP pyrophosphohydrolase [Candidatus Liberibacter solanacearum]